ncbi:MAG TPA: hypothetical protein VM597_22645 [Gemmataceae bacterium]|jgi:hypothetical protein|nr:hypothetical protein [Gemmataceae bacterium]
MATVTLTRFECERGLLPDVCMFCGVPATVRRRKTFGATGWFTTTKMVLRVPACDRHANYWVRQAVILVGTFLVVAALGFLASVLEELGHPRGTLSVIAAVVLLFGWLVLLGVYLSIGVRPTELTDAFVRLTDVHVAFIEALEAERSFDPRDQAAHGDERDDYDEIRPPRRRTSEHGDYLPRRRPLTADEPDDRPRRDGADD